MATPPMNCQILEREMRELLMTDQVLAPMKTEDPRPPPMTLYRGYFAPYFLSSLGREGWIYHFILFILSPGHMIC